MSDNQKLAKQVVAAFNTWAYKREQPSSFELLCAAVEVAVLHQRPIPFVLYWGKGPRNYAAEPERDCFNFLQSMLTRIASIYKQGAHLELLLTDTHALLNNHSKCSIKDYFASVQSEAGARGMSTRFLSSLSTNQANPDHGTETNHPSEATLDALIASASKWYRGVGTAREGALAYYTMNMSEKRSVEHFYKNSIFLTFNGSDLNSLFPAAMPIFYMYSMRKGCAVKPWFMAPPSEPAFTSPNRTVNHLSCCALGMPESQNIWR